MEINLYEKWRELKKAENAYKNFKSLFGSIKSQFEKQYYAGQFEKQIKDMTDYKARLKECENKF